MTIGSPASSVTSPMGGIRAAAGQEQLIHAAARRSALVRYDVLDTSPEPALETLVALVRRVLNAPMVAIALADADRQWIKAKIGFQAHELQHAAAFCTDIIRSHGPIAVNDTQMGDCQPRQIRAYLGAPLAMPDGYNIGALCVMDDKTRDFSVDETELVVQFAELVMAQIELRQIAQVDALTSALTRRAFMGELERVHGGLALAGRPGPPAALALFDLDRFKTLNDTYGHIVGDAVLEAACQAAKGALRSSDILGRIGGEEFAVLLRSCEPADALAIVERMRAAIATAGISEHPGLKFTASFGIAGASPPLSDRMLTVQDWIAAADEALYAAKRGGRNLTRMWGFDADPQ